jgi:iron complex transport system ATP-binding protein
VGNLSARGLRLTHGDRTILDGVDLEAQPGAITAIVGPNGAGKTTLLNALAGAHKPKAGSVELDGVSIATLGPAERARAVTILSGGVAPPTLSVHEAVETGRFAHHAWWDWRRTESDALEAAEAIRRVGLETFAERAFDSLSSGEQQRAWIALALAQGARVLLLDEPTSHLDVRYAHDVLGLLKRLASEGATVVVVLHDLNEAAAYADHVALLAAGSVVAQGPPRTLIDPVLLEQAYGVGFVTVEVDGHRRVFCASPIGGLR